MMSNKITKKSSALTHDGDKIVKCASCQRVLKSPQEWVEGNQTIVCNACYKDLMFRHPTKGHQGIMH